MVHVDVIVPMVVGARQHTEICSRCDGVMDWVPGTTAMDVGGVKGSAFQAFETYDGRNQKVTVSNMRDLRKLERDSEQQARNGEGQPLVFRHWSQDASNADQHAIHGSFLGAAETPDPAWRAKHKAVPRTGGEEAAFGPGVTEANASALPK